MHNFKSTPRGMERSHSSRNSSKRQPRRATNNALCSFPASPLYPNMLFSLYKCTYNLPINIHSAACFNAPAHNTTFAGRPVCCATFDRYNNPAVIVIAHPVLPLTDFSRLYYSHVTIAINSGDRAYRTSSELDAIETLTRSVPVPSRIKTIEFN